MEKVAELAKFKWFAEVFRKGESDDSPLAKTRYEIINLIINNKHEGYVSVNDYSNEFLKEFKEVIVRYGGKSTTKTVEVDGENYILFRISFEWLKE